MSAKKESGQPEQLKVAFREAGHAVKAIIVGNLRIVRILLSQTRAVSQSQLEKLERRLLDKIEYLLTEEKHSKAVHSVANELMEKTMISGRAVLHLFDQPVKRFGQN